MFKVGITVHRYRGANGSLNLCKESDQIEFTSNVFLIFWGEYRTLGDMIVNCSTPFYLR